MFEDNRALRQATSGRGRWNPWDVSSEFRAREAARAGWFVAAWQAVWGVIGLVFGGAVFATAAAPSEFTSAGLVLIAGAIYVGIYAGLGWAIRQWQPRWASIVLLVLMVLLLLGGLITPNFGVIINVALTGLTVLSVRGAFAAARFRRDTAANPAAAAQTFE